MTKTPKKDEQSAPAAPAAPEGIMLKVDWHFPEGLTSKFANHLVVQRDENEVFVSFFELQPPVIMSAEDAKEKLKSQTTIRATCVAKIAVSQSRWAGFVKAIQETQPVPGSQVQAITDDSAGSISPKKGKRR
jgi:hypothetical protein